MLEELDTLARRIDQLAQLSQSLRADNAALQSRLDERDAEILRLQGLVAHARDRVEVALARLPGGEDPSDDDAGHSERVIDGTA